MDSCIFCKISDKKIPATIVFENEKVVAFRDLNPQAPHHILIIPKKHISKIIEIRAEDHDLLGEMFEAANKIAGDSGFSEEGYRLVINNGENAGQSVFHLHLHLLGGRNFSWPPG